MRVSLVADDISTTTTKYPWVTCTKTTALVLGLYFFSVLWMSMVGSVRRRDAKCNQCMCSCCQNWNVNGVVAWLQNRGKSRRAPPLQQRQVGKNTGDRLCSSKHAHHPPGVAFLCFAALSEESSPVNQSPRCEIAQNEQPWNVSLNTQCVGRDSTTTGRIFLIFGPEHLRMSWLITWDHWIFNLPCQSCLRKKQQKTAKIRGFQKCFAPWPMIWCNLLKILGLMMIFQIYPGHQAMNCSKILHGCWFVSGKKIGCFWFFSHGEAVPSFKSNFFGLGGCLNSVWSHPGQI